jgi:acyl-CoA hydrolase
MLAEGAKVTVPRQDIDWVVTEYGAVHLQGRTVRERVDQLISVAHPDFRNDLRRGAEAVGYL